MKQYQPIYIPAGEEEEFEAPIFSTDDEAWEWIKEESKKCLLNRNKPFKPCNACMAEWDVEVLIDNE